MYDLEKMLEQLEPLKQRQIEIVHVLGNHCEKLERSVLFQKLGLQSSYYSLSLSASVRLLVLDTNEISLNKPEGSDERRQAENMLLQMPLEAHPQMHQYNGAVSNAQCRWLEQELKASRESGQHVLIAHHHPIAPGSARDSHLLWNYRDVLALVCANADVVAACLCGHDHAGGYTCLHSVHFVTLEGLLEAKSSTAYAVLTLYPDCVEIRTGGDVTPRSLPLNPWPNARLQES